MLLSGIQDKVLKLIAAYQCHVSSNIILVLLLVGLFSTLFSTLLTSSSRPLGAILEGVVRVVFLVAQLFQSVVVVSLIW